MIDAKVKLGMAVQIEIHNADGLCAHKTCSDKPTCFAIMEFKDTQYVIPLCKFHATLFSVEILVKNKGDEE